MGQEGRGEEWGWRRAWRCMREERWGRVSVYMCVSVGMRVRKCVSMCVLLLIDVCVCVCTSVRSWCCERRRDYSCMEEKANA